MIDTEHNAGLTESEKAACRALLLAGVSDHSMLAELIGVSGAAMARMLARIAEEGGSGTGLEERTGGRPPTATPAAALRVLIHRRQALLHQESAELERLRGFADRLADRLHPGPGDGALGGFELLTGSGDIGARADGMLAAAETEVLILDRPPYVKELPESVTEGAGQAGLAIRNVLDRGVTVRTIIDRAGLDHPGKMRVLTELVQHGLQARVSPFLPTKLIVADRRTCLLPPSDSIDPTETALVLGNSLLRNAVLPLFESLWEHAVPVGATGTPLAPSRRELLGLLASGLKDEAIARRLGVHVHTARRRISLMLDELDASTRFQAGAQAAIRGWLHGGSPD